MTMQISEDGKYKWDGNEWIPIDAAPAAPAPAAAPAAEAAPISVAVSALGTSYSWMEADEVVTDECTGILEYTTANPILRIINSIALLFMSILGFKQKVKLIVTNKKSDYGYS